MLISVERSIFFIATLFCYLLHFYLFIYLFCANTVLKVAVSKTLIYRYSEDVKKNPNMYQAEFKASEQKEATLHFYNSVAEMPGQSCLLLEEKQIGGWLSFPWQSVLDPGGASEESFL